MEKKKNIYIVDDIQENLKVLGNILQNNNYNISFAQNGEQAIKGISKKLPDLILLDVSMPVMDGFETCKRLKENLSTKNIPVIFLTAKTETEDIVNGFKLGGVDYITKPFNSEELLIRVKTHLDLKEAREKLIELNATKDKFFRIIAHDLKSPFNSIIGLTDLIMKRTEDFSPDKIKEFMGLLHSTSTTTYKLLENLLTWARSQSGAIPYSPEKMSLKYVVLDNITLLNNSAKNKGISLIEQIDDTEMVFADRNMITTVVRNLLSNAIKFTPENGIIKVNSIHSDNEMIISVEDNGVGMSLKNQNKLFRIDMHHTTQGTNDEKGTGLGLILCKEFIDKHNGRIWVESEVGKGSTFKFSIPTN